MPRLHAGATVSVVCLLSGLLAAAPDAPPAERTEPSSGAAERGAGRGPIQPARPAVAKARKARTARRPARPGPDEPPACTCTLAERPTNPPARSMPDLFQRMAERFARDPATGFNGMVAELSALEGPAVQEIRVSEAEEREAGLRARAEYLERARARGFRVVDDPKRLAYLRTLVDRLARRMRHRARYPKIEVTLIDAPVPDGQSFPGGFLAFTTALLDEPDEATVAGVVAHELAHLDRGHLYGYVRRSKLAEATYRRPVGSGADFDRFFTSQAALLGLLVNPFRPEHETEADCTAVTWLYLEGYDPGALVTFFERMHERNRDAPANPFFSYGRSHPYSLERRAHVQKRLAQLRRWRPGKDLGLFPENLRKLEPRPE